MSKPSYEDLVNILTKVYGTSRLETVLGCEWVNYPVEVFEEVVDIVTELKLQQESSKYEHDRLPD